MYKEGVDFYFEDGLMVFTEQYHKKRGYCCGNACRHCPYNFENVQEPRKSEARKSRRKKLFNRNE
jgi:hypothetical protein